MTRKVFAVLQVALFTLAAQAQTVRFIRAFGEASVSVTPDQAKLQFSVVTQAPTAQAAAAQNATQATTLLTALRSVLGQDAQLKTLNYSLNPNYSTPRDGSQPVIVGYTASNTLELTMTDLAAIGRVIDTGVQAGGNRVQGLQFGLKNDQPARQQALKLATAQAKAHADAIASGLNLRTGAVVSIDEGSAVRPLTGILTTAAATPVLSGQIDVQATVTLVIEIAP